MCMKLWKVRVCHWTDPSKGLSAPRRLLILSLGCVIIDFRVLVTLRITCTLV